MPILPGIKNMRRNYNELTQNPVQSAGREKAIHTLMKTRNMTHDEAIHTQALAIVKSAARKHK